MAILITYNINGIRAVLRKDFSTWLERANPDIICLQEIKAKANQFDIAIAYEIIGADVPPQELQFALQSTR